MTHATRHQILGALILVVTTGVARADIIHVKMEKLGFVPTDITAHVGDTIEWVNKDIFDHTATAKNGAFNVDIPAGKKARIVLKRAGEIDYFCEYHPNMTARVVVAKAPQNQP